MEVLAEAVKSWVKWAKLQIKEGINLSNKSDFNRPCSHLFAKEPTKQRQWTRLCSTFLPRVATLSSERRSCRITARHRFPMRFRGGGTERSNTWSVFGSLTAQEHLHKTPITRAHKSAHKLQYIAASKLDWWAPERTAYFKEHAEQNVSKLCPQARLYWKGNIKDILMRERERGIKSWRQIYVPAIFTALIRVG